MTANRASPEWNVESVRRQLRENAGSDGEVSAQVFFDETVAADRLFEAAEKAIGEAQNRLKTRRAVRPVRCHRLAKSVSVHGDPDVIAELQTVASVRAVLPSEITDVFPQPVKIRTD